MTGAELFQLTTDILDGEKINEDFFYQLLNIAKTRLEEGRAWQYLKKLDSSNTATTSAISLPTDFARDYKLMVGTDNEYIPVPFEDHHAYQDVGNRYYIDHANGYLYLTGTPKADTVYFYYLRYTPDVEAGTSPVFPARFHPILAFYVAGYYQNGVDSDDLFARMSPENKTQAVLLENAMKTWDMNLQLKAQNNRVGVANSEPESDLSQW
jgi:hypothetical protein